VKAKALATCEVHGAVPSKHWKKDAPSRLERRNTSVGLRAVDHRGRSTSRVRALEPAALAFVLTTEHEYLKNKFRASDIIKPSGSLRIDNVV
jgi:hypothetical protein